MASRAGQGRARRSTVLVIVLSVDRASLLLGHRPFCGELNVAQVDLQLQPLHNEGLLRRFAMFIPS